MTPPSSNRKQTPVGYDHPRELGGPISQGSKAADFIMGAFGLPGIQVVLSVLLIMVIGNPLMKTETMIHFLLVECLVSIGIYVWAFGSGRRYLALGYMTFLSGLVVVALLMIGACASLLKGL